MVQEGRNEDRRTTTCGPYRVRMKARMAGSFEALTARAAPPNSIPARVSRLTLSEDQENEIGGSRLF